MATLNDFIKKIDQLKELAKARLPEIATTLTLSAKALSERNILERGFGESYSKKDVPAWFFEDKELNKSGSSFIEKLTDKASKKKPAEKAKTNWGEFRGAQGLQNEFVDLHYTGFMFSNMVPQPPIIKGTVYIVNLGATNREAQDKMNWNYKRYGDFITKGLTEKDDKILFSLVSDSARKLMEEINL